MKTKHIYKVGDTFRFYNGRMSSIDGQLCTIVKLYRPNQYKYHVQFPSGETMIAYESELNKSPRI